MTTTPDLPPDYSLVVYNTVDSVVDEAKRLAAQGAEEGTLVWAKQQSSGHGRFGRPWFSPPGNLHCALILRLEEPADIAVQVNYVAAVSLGATIAELIGPAELHYRWPNDVLLNDVKVAGLLLEAAPRSSANTYDWLVLGAAVNVNASPPDIEVATVSAYSDRFGGVSDALVLEGFGRHFLSWINRWADEGFTPVRKTWTLRARSIGQPTKVELRDHILEGRFVEVDQEGAMVMEMADGKYRRITVGKFFSL